ncbi:MAG: hypothetical protein H6709_03835 [Kofleriaceae bacterium]|nr:hypothetical protein [Kofleriaceae bacterium]MCB9571201.1 hypothetical protein [Kofleriaceae bacterium]
MSAGGRRGRGVATVAGVAVLVAHAAALPLALDRCRRDELEVDVTGAPVAAGFDLDGAVPAGLRARIEDAVDGVAVTPATALAPDAAGPGLHRRTWTVRYQGGYARTVGAAQLVGPFQDPAAPPCGARLVVGQRLLDDGAAGPGTVAALIHDALETELAGFEQFPVGRFQRVSKVEVRWARFDASPEDRHLFGDLIGDPGVALGATWHTDGYARVFVVLELDRVSVEVTVAAVPRVDGDRLAFGVFAAAHLAFGNRVVDFAASVLRADDRATEVARQQIDAAILQAFDPPPPLPLPGGRSLEVRYCPGARVTVAAGGYAALPLALRFGGPGAGGALPPRLGPAHPPPPAADTVLAFDLDLDTINALLFELWRTGYLDDELDAAGLDRRFNEDPLVTSLLSLRMSPLRLALPPVVVPGAAGLRMAADLRVNLADGDVLTPGRVWAALDVDLDAADAEVGLGDLELACEPTPGRLRPCYGDLVTAVRARGGDARDQLSGVLRDILDELFTGQRVRAPDAPAELVLGAPRTASVRDGATATVRISLDGRLEAHPPP